MENANEQPRLDRNHVAQLTFDLLTQALGKVVAIAVERLGSEAADRVKEVLGHLNNPETCQDDGVRFEIELPGLHIRCYLRENGIEDKEPFFVIEGANRGIGGAQN